jgi:hypothetical protein
MADAPPRPRLGTLLDLLSTEVSSLVQLKVGLVRAEFGQTARGLALVAALIVAGVVLVVAGVFTLIAALVLAGVAIGLPPWAASLLVGIASLGVGAFLAWGSIERARGLSVVPTASIESLKEDVAWLRAQITR